MAAKIKTNLSKSIKIFFIISIAFFYSTLVYLRFFKSRQIILHKPNNMMLTSEEYVIYEKFLNEVTPASENEIGKLVPEASNDMGGPVKVLNNLLEGVKNIIKPRSKSDEFLRKLILIRRNLPVPLSNSEKVIPGLIRNVGLGNQTCITAAELGSPLTLTKCNGANYNQFWMLSRDKNIRNGDFCLNFSYHFHELTLEKCVEEYQRQEFKYIPEKKQIYFHSADLCMTIIQLFDYQHEAYMTECDDYDENQQWHIDNFDESKIR